MKKLYIIGISVFLVGCTPTIISRPFMPEVPELLMRPPQNLETIKPQEQPKQDSTNERNDQKPSN